MARRRIKKAKIHTISLVPKGANKLPVLYKEDGSCEIATISRMDDLGEITAIVYAAEHRDSEGDITDAAVIKGMAYDFFADHGKIDVRHDGKALTAAQASIGESFLVHKSDTRFHGWKDRDNQPVDLTDAWATVIKIHDENLRQKYRSGEWTGVSMAGTAVVEHEKEDQLEHFADTMLKMLGLPVPARSKKQEDTEMDEKVLADIVGKSIGEAMKPMGEGLVSLTKSLEKVFEAVAKSAATEPIQKKDELPKADEKPPVFKGDANKDEDLLKHERNLETYELRQSIADLGTAAGMKEFREKSAELRKTWEEEDAKNPPKKVETKKVSKTNQETDSDEPENRNKERIRGLSKEDSEAFRAGQEAARGIHPNKKETAAKA